MSTLITLIALVCLLIGMVVGNYFPLRKSIPTVLVVDDEDPIPTHTPIMVSSDDQTFFLEGPDGTVKHEIHSHTLSGAPPTLTYHEVTYYLTSSKGLVHHYQVPADV